MLDLPRAVLRVEETRRQLRDDLVRGVRVEPAHRPHVGVDEPLHRLRVVLDELRRHEDRLRRESRAQRFLRALAGGEVVERADAVGFLQRGDDGLLESHDVELVRLQVGEDQFHAVLGGVVDRVVALARQPGLVGQVTGHDGLARVARALRDVAALEVRGALDLVLHAVVDHHLHGGGIVEHHDRLDGEAVAHAKDRVVEPMLDRVDLALHQRLLDQVVLLDELRDLHRDDLDALLLEVAEAVRQSGHDHVLIEAHADLGQDFGRRHTQTEAEGQKAHGYNPENRECFFGGMHKVGRSVLHEAVLGRDLG